MHECDKAKEIEKISNAVFGDNGLKESYVRMETTFVETNKSLDKLATAVSGLTQFMNELQGERKKENENKSTIKWIVGMSITMFIGLTATIVTLIIKT